MTRSSDDWHERPFDPLPLLRVLALHRVEYVVIGGVAAVLQGSPHPTFDVDIAAAPGRSNASRLRAALTEIGGRERTPAPTDHRFNTRYGQLDIHYDGAGFPRHAELARHALLMDLEPGLVVSVARLRDVIRSRLASGDMRQLPALVVALDATELRRGAVRRARPREPRLGARAHGAAS